LRPCLPSNGRAGLIIHESLGAAHDSLLLQRLDVAVEIPSVNPHRSRNSVKGIPPREAQSTDRIDIRFGS